MRDLRAETRHSAGDGHKKARTAWRRCQPCQLAPTQETRSDFRIFTRLLLLIPHRLRGIYLFSDDIYVIEGGLVSIYRIEIYYSAVCESAASDAFVHAPANDLIMR